MAFKLPGGQFSRELDLSSLVTQLPTLHLWSGEGFRAGIEPATEGVSKALATAPYVDIPPINTMNQSTEAGKMKTVY